MLDAAHDHLVPAGLQFKEFPVHKGELVVPVVQAPFLPGTEMRLIPVVDSRELQL